MIFKKNKSAFNQPKPLTRMVCWFEIPARDFYRATNFYYKVFEFDVDEVEFNGVQHGIIKSRNKTDVINGAIVHHPELQPQHQGTVLFFDVNGWMEIAHDRIISNGGKILKEKTLIINRFGDNKVVIPKNLIDGKQGYYSYFCDPEGNVMGLYSNS